MAPQDARAGRLAKVLVQDIALYSLDALAAARDRAALRRVLEDQIREGRALFRARTDRAQWPIYERALDALLGDGPPVLATPDEAARLADAIFDHAEAEAPARDRAARLAALDVDVARGRPWFRRHVTPRWHTLYEARLARRAEAWLSE